MTLLLIRHAAAGDRYRWAGDDVDRPLSGRGHDQAENLAKVYGESGITRLLSSRAVRCQQTLGPLAHRLGLTVETVPELSEGARTTDAIALLEQLRDTDAALCSHGDVIPEVIRRLMADGMSVIGNRGCEKGSVWELEVRGRDFVRGHYRAEPTL